MDRKSHLMTLASKKLSDPRSLQEKLAACNLDIARISKRDTKAFISKVNLDSMDSVFLKKNMIFEELRNHLRSWNKHVEQRDFIENEGALNALFHGLAVHLREISQTYILHVQQSYLKNVKKWFDEQYYMYSEQFRISKQSKDLTLEERQAILERIELRIAAMALDSETIQKKMNGNKQTNKNSSPRASGGGSSKKDKSHGQLNQQDWIEEQLQDQNLSHFAQPFRLERQCQTCIPQQNRSHSYGGIPLQTQVQFISKKLDAKTQFKLEIMKEKLSKQQDAKETMQLGMFMNRWSKDRRQQLQFQIARNESTQKGSNFSGLSYQKKEAEEMRLNNPLIKADRSYSPRNRHSSSIGKSEKQTQKSKNHLDDSEIIEQKINKNLFENEDEDDEDNDRDGGDKNAEENLEIRLRKKSEEFTVDELGQHINAYHTISQTRADDGLRYHNMSNNDDDDQDINSAQLKNNNEWSRQYENSNGSNNDFNRSKYSSSFVQNDKLSSTQQQWFQFDVEGSTDHSNSQQQQQLSNYNSNQDKSQQQSQNLRGTQSQSFMNTSTLNAINSRASTSYFNTRSDSILLKQRSLKQPNNSNSNTKITSNSRIPALGTTKSISSVNKQYKPNNVYLFGNDENEENNNNIKLPKQILGKNPLGLQEQLTQDIKRNKLNALLAAKAKILNLTGNTLNGNNNININNNGSIHNTNNNKTSSSSADFEVLTPELVQERLTRSIHIQGNRVRQNKESQISQASDARMLQSQMEEINRISKVLSTKNIRISAYNLKASLMQPFNPQIPAHSTAIPEIGQSIMNFKEE